jgi:hypothetical protein
MHFFDGRQGYVGVDSETRQGGREYLIAASEASGLLVGSGTGLRVDFDGVRVQVYEPHFGDARRSIKRDTHPRPPCDPQLSADSMGCLAANKLPFA